MFICRNDAAQSTHKKSLKFRPYILRSIERRLVGIIFLLLSYFEVESDGTLKRVAAGGKEDTT